MNEVVAERFVLVSPGGGKLAELSMHEGLAGPAVAFFDGQERQRLVVGIASTSWQSKLAGLQGTPMILLLDEHNHERVRISIEGNKTGIQVRDAFGQVSFDSSVE